MPEGGKLSPFLTGCLELGPPEHRDSPTFHQLSSTDGIKVSALEDLDGNQQRVSASEAEEALNT